MSLDQIRQLSASQPSNERARYYLGVRLRDAGQLAQARDAFQQAAQANPDDEQAWLSWASAAQSLGSDREAFAALSRFEATHPNSANAHKALSRFYASHWVFDTAYDEAATAAKLAPRDVDAWVLLGGRAMDMSLEPKAEEAFRQAVKLNPNDWQNLLSLAFVLQTEKRYDDALVYYRQANELAPNEPGTMLALGGMLLKTAQTPEGQQEALSLLKRAVSMNPSSPPGCRMLGQAYLQAGNYQEARQYLTRAEGLSPGDPTVHFDLQQVYSRLGDTASAAKEAKEHSEIVSFLLARERLHDQAHLTPNDLAVGLKYARLCAAHGDYLDAVLEYRQLMAIHPDAKEVRSEFAVVEKKLPQNATVQ
jgi:tetratricopeptide (TPR) repeat protein